MRLAALPCLLSTAAMLALAACSSAPTRSVAPAPASTPRSPAISTARGASIVMTPASGSLVSGKLSAAPMQNGVRITGELGGLSRGSTHAIHIHETGDCSAYGRSASASVAAIPTSAVAPWWSMPRLTTTAASRQAMPAHAWPVG